MVGRRGGLPVAEEGGNDNEIVLWAQRFVLADKPFVVGYCWAQRLSFEQKKKKDTNEQPEYQVG